MYQAYAEAYQANLPMQKPADRFAVAASLNSDLARIQEWCNHWWMILNLNKTKALVVGWSRTVNHPHGNLLLSGVFIRANPNLYILGVKFDTTSPSKTMCMVCPGYAWENTSTDHVKVFVVESIARTSGRCNISYIETQEH